MVENLRRSHLLVVVLVVAVAAALVAGHKRGHLVSAGKVRAMDKSAAGTASLVALAVALAIVANLGLLQEGRADYA